MHCYTLDVALRVVDVCGLKQQLVLQWRRLEFQNQD